MNTPRFNLFNQIHKALRAFLFDSVLQLQQTDLTNIDKSKPVLIQIQSLLDLFDSHAWHEDNFVLTAVKEHAPDIIAMFEQEHVEDHRLSEQLQEKITAWWQAEDKYEAGRQLFYALNDFVAFNLRHMNKEEMLLNNILWQHYSDDEILAIERNIQQAVSPDKMQVAIEWMVKGINDEELMHWIGGVKHSAPQPVLQALLAACAKHLPAQRWQRLAGHGDLIVS